MSPKQAYILFRSTWTAGLPTFIAVKSWARFPVWSPHFPPADDLKLARSRPDRRSPTL